MAGNGNFYAVRLLEGMNVNPARGALRLSLLHYNAAHEVKGVLPRSMKSSPRAAAGTEGLALTMHNLRRRRLLQFAAAAAAAALARQPARARAGKTLLILGGTGSSVRT